VERDRPVLAICRGIQALNVAMGGTLYQDLRAQVPEALVHQPAPLWEADGRLAACGHEVTVEDGSVLAATLGRRRVSVLSPAAKEVLGLRLIATLATLAEDGSLHAVPMWFRWDGTSVLIPTSARTRKIRNLRRTPRATVTVDQCRGGMEIRGVMLVGTAEITEGADARQLNRSIHLRYVTAEGLALPEVRHYLDTDDVTIQVRPDRVATWDLTESPASRALARAGLALPLDG
jgi:PPOX class probable F420-dependent enzyme